MSKLFTVYHDKAGPASTIEYNVPAVDEQDAIYRSKLYTFGCDANKLSAEEVDTTGMSRADIAVLRLPVAFRSMVLTTSSDRGHSAGEDEVGVIAEGMVNDLLPCISAFVGNR